MKLPFLIGRVAFGGFFLYNGIHHFSQRRVLSQYAAAKKVPAPGLAVTASGALLTAAGASILLGFKPRYGVLGIASFLATVSPMMHDFWHAEEPGQRQADMIQFSKNMALLGAALSLLGVEEPWPAALQTPPASAWDRGMDSVRHAIAA